MVVKIPNVLSLKNIQSLENLIMASFLGTGDISLIDGPKIVVDIDTKKFTFLKNYLTLNNLENYVVFDQEKGEYIIQHPVINKYHKLWYKGQKKAFNASSLNYNAIILSLIIFGKRKIEYLSLETTIEKKYIRTLAYTLECFLKIPIIPSNKGIKMHDTATLLSEAIPRLGMNECIELVSFLSEKEKKKKEKGIYHMRRRCYYV